MDGGPEDLDVMKSPLVCGEGGGGDGELPALTRCGRFWGEVANVPRGFGLTHGKGPASLLPLQEKKKKKGKRHDRQRRHGAPQPSEWL